MPEVAGTSSFVVGGATTGFVASGVEGCDTGSFLTVVVSTAAGTDDGGAATGAGATMDGVVEVVGDTVVAGPTGAGNVVPVVVVAAAIPAQR